MKMLMWRRFHDSTWSSQTLPRPACTLLLLGKKSSSSNNNNKPTDLCNISVAFDPFVRSFMCVDVHLLCTCTDSRESRCLQTPPPASLPPLPLHSHSPLPHPPGVKVSYSICFAEADVAVVKVSLFYCIVAQLMLHFSCFVLLHSQVDPSGKMLYFSLLPIGSHGERQ